jgi:hypothetical protein
VESVLRKSLDDYCLPDWWPNPLQSDHVHTHVFCVHGELLLNGDQPSVSYVRCIPSVYCALIGLPIITNYD